MKYIIIILFGFLLFTQSCKKSTDSNFLPSGNPSSFVEIFEAFWHGMNENYVYWDIDTTHWNSFYERYKPLFNELNLNDKEDLRKSVRYFREMTDGLIDAHFEIRFKVAEIADSIINPAANRKSREASWHKPTSYFAIAEKMLGQGFIKGFDNANNQGRGPLFAISGTINKDILYFGCNEFSLQRSYFATGDNPVKHVLQYFFDKIANEADSLSGIIIDLRNNFGGDIVDLNFFVGHLIQRPLLLGYFHTKRSGNPLDYTPWLTITVPPLANSLKREMRFTLLADNYSASLSELIVMALRTIHGSIVIGETTYGAQGPITGNKVYNSGSFTVGDFLSVRTSSAAFKYFDNKIYEGEGFPPDLSIPYNEDSVSNGVDVALNRAIQLIY